MFNRQRSLALTEIPATTANVATDTAYRNSFIDSFIVMGADNGRLICLGAHDSLGILRVDRGPLEKANNTNMQARLRYGMLSTTVCQLQTQTRYHLSSVVLCFSQICMNVPRICAK